METASTWTTTKRMTTAAAPGSGFTIEPGLYFEHFGVRTEIKMVYGRGFGHGDRAIADGDSRVALVASLLTCNPVGARLVRRELRAYRDYSSDEQRRQAGCPARQAHYV